MNASTVVVMTALGAGVLIDLPGLRYDIPLAGEPGPIERDLRWYGLTEPLPRGYELRRHDGIPLPPEWREQTELWDEALRERLDRESATESERLVRLWEPETIFVPLVLDGQNEVDLTLVLTETVDPSLPFLYGEHFRESLERDGASQQRSSPVPEGGITNSESRLPGDFNRDGTLSLADLDAYSVAFAANAPRADLNRDGQIDAEDLRIYIATFEANFRP